MKVVERTIFVPIIMSSIKGVPVAFDYSYNNDLHLMIVLGYAMLFNSNPNPSVEIGTNYLIPGIMSDGLHYGTDSSDIYFFATRDINAGEEIFVEYSEDYWSFRNITMRELDNPELLSSSVTTLPGCASSLTVVIKNRVYATQRIFAGDIVEVSRTLIMPSLVAKRNTHLENLVWRRNTTKCPSGNDLILLHNGNGALYKPPKMPGDANLQYDWWYDPSQSSGVECSNRTMFIKFTAIRDIVPSEELTIELGRYRLASERLFTYCNF